MSTPLSADLAPAGSRGLALSLAVACTAALFLLPFLWPLHTQPLPTFYNEAIAAMLLIAACFALCAVRKTALASVFELPAVIPVFIPLMAVILLQWGLDRFAYSSDAVFPLMTLVLATAALVVGRVLACEAGFSRLLFWFSIAAVTGGLLNVIVQVMQLCAANGIRFPYLNFRTNGAYFGVLAQRNHLASYLSWGLVGALYLHARGRIRVGSLLPLVAILLVGMSLTLSRTGLLQVVGIALAGVWLASCIRQEERPSHWRWLLALPVLYGIINFALPHVFDAIGLSFNGSALSRAATEGVDGGRRLLYAQGLQLFLAHPVLGIGPGQLFFSQFQLLDQVDQTLFASSTHNILLDLLVMTGVTGAVPFLLVAGLWSRRVMRQVVSIERSAALLMLFTLAIHSMLELPQWYAFFLLPAALLCGALDPGIVRLPRGKILHMLPFALCLYGALVAGSMWMQYRELERMFSSYHTKDRNPASVDEKRLVELLAFQRTTWFAAWTEYLLFTNIALNDIALQEKLAIASRTIRTQPEPHVVYRYVLLLALDGRQEEGLALLERTRKMFPTAYDEIVAEFTRLAEKQPALFGQLGRALEPST